MKKLLIENFLLLVGMFILGSCYDDKGSYTYGDINDINITLPSEISVQIPKADSVLVELTPTIAQIKMQDELNLRYQWKRKISDIPSVWNVCGEEKTCKLYVKPTDKKNIMIRLAVMDTKEGIISYKEIQIKMLQPFSRTWFVLQNMMGNSVLGCIDGDGKSGLVIKDVYKSELGEDKSLEGKPLFLAVNPRHPEGMFALGRESVVGVFTDMGGYMLDGSKLTPRYTYNELLLHKKIVGDGHIAPEYATGEEKGEAILDAGTFWYALPNGFSIYYPVKLDAVAGKSYYASRATVSMNGTSLVFDNLHKRFLKYNNSDPTTDYWGQKDIRNGKYVKYNIDGSANKPTLQLIGERPDFPNAFNPDEIGEDKDVVYMGATTNRDASKNIAIATSTKDNKIYIYEFSAKGIQDGAGANCSGFFTFQPEGDRGSWRFASSSGFDRIFFYASGNKIYRVDLNRTIPKAFLIYEHPTSSVRITTLKFRHDRADTGNWSENNDEEFIWNEFPYHLGCVVEYSAGGKCSVMDMKLSYAGDIARSETGEKMVYEYEGFKSIVDIGYSFK